jgi:hypothetical protein
MTAYGETVPEVRVVRTAGAVITLSLALAHVPPKDSDVRLLWSAAPRGRVAREGHVRSVDGNRVEVYFTSQPVMLQSRHYVRGGGGEPVTMFRPDEDDAVGTVQDMSERAIRAQFIGVKVRADDKIQLAVQIDDGLLEVVATPLKVNSGPRAVDLVALFEPDDELQAQRIRQYIMRHQLIARQRGL